MIISYDTCASQGNSLRFTSYSWLARLFLFRLLRTLAYIMAEPQGTISADDPSPAIPPVTEPQAAAGGDAPGHEEDDGSELDEPGEEDGDIEEEDDDDDDMPDSDDPFSEPSGCHASPQAMHRHNSFREPLGMVDSRNVVYIILFWRCKYCYSF